MLLRRSFYQNHRLFKIPFELLLTYHCPIGNTIKLWTSHLMIAHILGVRNDLHILNLSYTLIQLRKALNVVFSTIMGRGSILIYAQAHKSLKINQDAVFTFIDAWLPGLITNYKRVILSVYKNAKIISTIGTIYLKRPQLDALNAVQYRPFLMPSYVCKTRLKGRFAVIPHLSLSVLDAPIWLNECENLKIPSVQLCDSTSQYDSVTYPIISNQRSIPFTRLIVNLFAETCAYALMTEQLFATKLSIMQSNLCILNPKDLRKQPGLIYNVYKKMSPNLLNHFKEKLTKYEKPYDIKSKSHLIDFIKNKLKQLRKTRQGLTKIKKWRKKHTKGWWKSKFRKQFKRRAPILFKSFPHSAFAERRKSHLIQKIRTIRGIVDIPKDALFYERWLRLYRQKPRLKKPWHPKHPPYLYFPYSGQKPLRRFYIKHRFKNYSKKLNFYKALRKKLSQSYKSLYKDQYSIKYLTRSSVSRYARVNIYTKRSVYNRNTYVVNKRFFYFKVRNQLPKSVLNQYKTLKMNRSAIKISLQKAKTKKSLFNVKGLRRKNIAKKVLKLRRRRQITVIKKAKKAYVKHIRSKTPLTKKRKTINIVLPPIRNVSNKKWKL